MKKDLSFSIDFVVRKTKSNPLEGYLSAKVTINGTPTEISLNEKISVNAWQAGSDKLKGKSKEVESLNKYISDVRYRITESKRLLEAGRFAVTSEAIKLHYNNQHSSQKPPESGHTVSELVKKHEKLECSGDKLKKGTTKNYVATEKYLNNFMLLYFKQPDIDLIKFDYEALLEFESFIRSHPLKAFDPCLGNGVYKHMERVEKMFGMAKDMRWIKDNPFDMYKSKRKKVTRENLKIEQFIKIENHNFENDKISLVRDLFIFDCYVGVSYIDLMALETNHFELVDGHPFCTIYRTKSAELCGIPIPVVAQNIIDKYQNTPAALSRGKTFPYISNQEFNRNLKIIAGILNIPVDLDTRKARRFFAKEVNLKNGVPLETVSKLLGHSKISTTKEIMQMSTLKK